MIILFVIFVKKIWLYMPPDHYFFLETLDGSIKNNLPLPASCLTMVLIFTVDL